MISQEDRPPVPHEYKFHFHQSYFQHLLFISLFSCYFIFNQKRTVVESHVQTDTVCCSSFFFQSTAAQLLKISIQITNSRLWKLQNMHLSKFTGSLWLFLPHCFSWRSNWSRVFCLPHERKIQISLEFYSLFFVFS